MKRVDCMVFNPMNKERGRPRRTLRRRDLMVNKIYKDLVFN